MNRALVILGCWVLASCGTAVREETPAYFNKVTGLRLCDTAKVANKHTPETDLAGTGVVYVVSLKVTPECKADLLRQVDAIQAKLRPNGVPPDDTWISVEESGEELIVTYTS